MNEHGVLMQGLLYECMTGVFSDNCKNYVGVCMCGPVLSFHQAYMYNKQAFANPYASSHIPKILLPKIPFSHLPLESIGAPEYQ